MIRRKKSVVFFFFWGGGVGEEGIVVLFYSFHFYLTYLYLNTSFTVRGFFILKNKS